MTIQVVPVGNHAVQPQRRVFHWLQLPNYPCSRKPARTGTLVALRSIGASALTGRASRGTLRDFYSAEDSYGTHQSRLAFTTPPQSNSSSVYLP